MSASASNIEPARAEPTACLVCGGAVKIILPDCPDYYLATPYRVSYGRCTQCALVQQTPVPNDVSSFYRAYPMHKRRGRVQRIVRKLLRSPIYFRPPSGRRVALLDFGCGDGGYLESIAAPGRELQGYEVDANLAHRVAERTGLSINSSREELHALSNRFDFVTAHFVFEHLIDLVAGFADVSLLLKPGGIFYCVVPQFDSTEARLFGRRWHGLDPPRHISFPSTSIMKPLGTSADLALREHYPVPFANGFAGSVATFPFGRFNLPIFLLNLPLGSIFARFFPGGARAFVFEKRS